MLADVGVEFRPRIGRSPAFVFMESRYMGQQCILRLSYPKSAFQNNSYFAPISCADVGNGRAVPPTTAQKLAYGGFTVVVPYLLSKVEGWLTLSNDVAPEAWKDRLQRLITNAENVYSTFSLLNFLAFLVNGRYSPPKKPVADEHRYRSLPDRILKLQLLPLTKSQPHHLLSYEFLNRQLTWTSLTEFLLFILPLILPSYRRIRRRLVRSIKSEDSQIGALAELPTRFCAICFSKGREGRLITNPYCGECGHPYCYVCLMEEVAAEEGDGWACLRCGQVIRHIKRWEEALEDDETVVEVKVEDAEPAGEGEEQDSTQLEEIATPEEEEAEEEEEESNEEENLFSRR
jgi:peroxin-2